MSAATTSPATASLKPDTRPLASPPASPPPTSSTPIDDTALRAADAGVKKPAQKKKASKTGFKRTQKAKLALQKMHAFFRAHRGDDEYKDMAFPEQQKVLGKLWKASPENPKNSA